jgi:hypothetical protein
MDGPHFRTLREALRVLGSKERLATELGLAPGDLEAYLAGERRLPDKVFLRALDVVAAGKRDL